MGGLTHFYLGNMFWFNHGTCIHIVGQIRCTMVSCGCSRMHSTLWLQNIYGYYVLYMEIDTNKCHLGNKAYNYPLVTFAIPLVTFMVHNYPINGDHNTHGGDF